MDLFEKLIALGVDIDSALTRFMGNEELLKMMYKKLPEMITKNRDLVPLIESGKVDDATAKAHTLKGNMGNLSVTPLFEAYTEIVNLLRAGNKDEAVVKIKEIQPVQDQILQAISE